MGEKAASIEQIIEELRKGSANEESFRLLFEHYYPQLLRFFSRRGLSPEDCLDLIQETFLGIYRGIGSFRRQARFETWLFEVATNAYLKMLRLSAAKKRAAQEVPLDRHELGEDPKMQKILTSKEPGPDEEALCREQSRSLREAIHSLPRQMQRCLFLRVDQDLKYREIATTMRLSIGTVKVHLFEARLRLQKELGPDSGKVLSRLDDEES